MAKDNYWLKNGIINLLQNSLTFLLGFFSFILLVRILSPEDYGTWVLFLAVVGIIELARNGLTHEASVKFLSSATVTDKGKITTAAFAINTALSIIIAIIVLVIAPLLSKSWKAPEITHMLHLYIGIFFLSGIQNQLNAIEKANLSFVGIFYSNIARQLILFSFIFYCFITATTTTVIMLTYVQIISIAVATLIAFIYTRKKILFNKKVDVEWIKRIFHFGKYTFGVSLTSVLANSIDQMMLGSLLSKTASGVFNIAIRITNLTDIPTTAVANIVFPQSAKKIAESGTVAAKYMYERSVGVILSILVPIVLFIYIFADILIPLIAGQKYTDSIPLLRITLLTCIFSPYGLQAGIILTSAGKTKFNFFIVLFNATLIVALNYFLIKAIGIMGAAYSSLIAAFVGFTISQIYLKKLYGVNFLNPWIYAWKFYPEFYNKYVVRKKAET